MQMFFNPSESPPPQHHDSSVKHFYSLYMLFLHSCAPKQNMIATLHVECHADCAGTRPTNQHLCINWAKGHACKISDNIPNPGIIIVELPFAVFNRGLKNTEHYLPSLDIANVLLY